MYKTSWSHTHALLQAQLFLVALAHGVLALHAGLLAILRGLLLAVLGALALAVFRAHLIGHAAITFIHVYHLTVSSMPPPDFLYAERKKFFTTGTHPPTFML